MTLAIEETSGPEQFAIHVDYCILKLSWLAITFTAYDILTSTRVHTSVDKVKEANGESSS